MNIECPECGKSFVAAAIVTTEPEYSVQWGQHTVDRRVFCDHCDLIFGWEQVVSLSTGIPVGRPLREKADITRNIVTIDRFLRAHPEARGILQTP